MIRSICITLLTVLLIVPVAHSDGNSNHSELLAKYYRLAKPKGEGPFPAVILVPGCSGFNFKFAPSFYNDLQNKLSELGFATLRVNYLAARNIESCMGLTSTSAGSDICIAADYLNKHLSRKGLLTLLDGRLEGLLYLEH